MNPIVLIFIALLLLILILYLQLWIKRDPERKVPEGNNLVAPSDGFLIQIMEFYKGDAYEGATSAKVKEFTRDVAEEGCILTILTDFNNVHTIRAPIAGKMTKNEGFRGKHNPTFNFSSSLVNERRELIIKGKCKVKVIMVAGGLTFRIKSIVKVGQKVVKGQRLGRIIIGSVNHLIVPKEIVLKVKEGDTVRAGETIIGECV
jgi:phosphatidylserine decarboxylase